jgi:hypothetical protein
MSKVQSVSFKHSSLRLRFPLLLVLAGLLPVTARAQVSYTGTTAVRNFGSLAVDSTSPATSLSFSIAAGTKVGSIVVVTQGTQNLDFVAAKGGTCAAATYASATACTVHVTFKPKALGLRMGAVVFYSNTDNTGTILGKVLVYGVGTGSPHTGWGLGSVTAITPVVNGSTVEPWVAVPDAAGDLFMTDQVGAYNRVLEVPVGGGTPKVIVQTQPGAGVWGIWGMAVDGAGDLFIAELGGTGVLEVPAGGGASTVINPIVNGQKALNRPKWVALNGLGDLFITDQRNARVVEVPADGGPAVFIDPIVNGLGLDPLDGDQVNDGLAVDGAGDLFIADWANNRVVEVPAGGGAPTAIDPSVDGVPLTMPYALAVDGAGDLFMAANSDLPDSGVVELPAGGGAPIVLTFSHLSTGVPSLATDGRGDLFFPDYGVLEVLRSGAPALIFPAPTFASATDAYRAQTVALTNFGSDALTLTGIGFPADFFEASGDKDACTNGVVLDPGAACDVPIQFSPKKAGALSEAVTVTYDSPKVTGAKLSILVSGVGVAGVPKLTYPTPNSVLSGSIVNFTWTAGTGVTGYQLVLGSTGPGSHDLYNHGYTPATSSVVTGLPTNGERIYARLSFEGMGGCYIDYSFIAAGANVPAALTKPAPNTILAGSSVNFKWTAGTGVTEYQLVLGSTGPGSYGLYNSGPTTATSAAATGLPTDGKKIYARLYSVIDGLWDHTDYAYIASGTNAPAAITTPAPNTILAGSSVNFKWTAGTGVTEYQLVLGSTGPGSYDLYNSGHTTATSAAATGLPTNGKKIYARLYSVIGGVWDYTDYLYTAHQGS